MTTDIRAPNEHEIADFLINEIATDMNSEPGIINTETALSKVDIVGNADILQYLYGMALRFNLQCNPQEIILNLRASGELDQVLKENVGRLAEVLSKKITAAKK